MDEEYGKDDEYETLPPTSTRNPIEIAGNISEYLRRGDLYHPFMRMRFHGKQSSREPSSPVQYTDVRWASILDLLTWMSKNKDFVVEFFQQEDAAEEYSLSNNEWSILQDLSVIMEVLNKPQKQLQSKIQDPNATISQTVLMMDELYENLQGCLDIPETDHFVVECLTARWAKLEKYKALLYNTPIYNVAVVMDPGRKSSYFAPTPDRHEIVKEQLWTM